MKKDFPVTPPVKRMMTLAEWRKNAPLFFFFSRDTLKKPFNHSVSLIERAERILKGEIQFFNGEWKSLAPDDWLTNILSGHKYDNNLHWTQIPDFHPACGDIKYVWEKNRFLFLQTILRYDQQTASDSSAWVFSQIESWIKNNPINQGPNYRCSQEISIRLFNWMLALYFYRDSKNLTEERFNIILFHVYWQLRHVRANIHFSRIAVRNNHAITETLALYTAGLLFPFFEESREWKLQGKKWFEEEIAYQIYPDGSYLQFSYNYHRVVIQLLTWAISLADIHGEKFKPVVYERAMASLFFLLHAQDPVSGGLPNYGANDGSLFFNWNDEDFRNFRPALDTLHFLLTGENIYSTSYDDRMWFGVNNSLKMFKPVWLAEGTASFPDGGIHVFRTKDMLVWINCLHYKDRPLQADNLHLDVWYNGENILLDAGSYRYNTSEDKVKYFSGTEAHNTVMLGDYDQMLKGPRFIWLDWSKRLSAQWEGKIFSAEALVYGYLGNISHKRTVKIEANHLVVTDEMKGSEGKLLRQLWHVNPLSKVGIELLTNGDAKRIEREGFYSSTYGSISPSRQIEFQTLAGRLTTEISFT
ncbi:MAG: alginate lyase family protein [Cyclobacteriaceae bacterium]